MEREKRTRKKRKGAQGKKRDHVDVFVSFLVCSVLFFLPFASSLLPNRRHRGVRTLPFSLLCALFFSQEGVGAALSQSVSPPVSQSSIALPSNQRPINRRPRAPPPFSGQCKRTCE